MNEDINIEGWKGKGDYEIEPTTDKYHIIEHRKSKETGENYTDEHWIPKINVEVLWGLILKHYEQGEKYGYQYLVRKTIEHYKWHEDEGVPIEFFMTAFNGGKFRAKYYFPYLYYPLKVLEAQNKITYFGRGGIQLNS